ncbi:MAG: endonuclease/exonuclease/phosphatase family protein [Bacteroidota bacterium]
MRCLFLALVLAASGAGCSGPAAPAASEGEPLAPFAVEAPPAWDVDGLRIATLNAEFLFDGEGDEGGATFAWKGDPEAARAHLDDIAEVVRALDADLVLISEVENAATLAALAEAVGQGHTATLVDGQDSFTGQDVGLLSALPVEAAGRTDERVEVGLSEQTYGVSKNLWARLTLAGRPVTVVGVHFLARPDDVERRDRREAQAETIRRLVAREVAMGREVVVLGDFNDFDDAVLDRRSSRPITDVMATVKAAGPGPEDDLVNVLGDVPQAERFTSHWDRDRDGVFDEGEFSAIDHVLLSPGLYRLVRDVRYVHAHNPLTVSDHFPVVVTLEE